MATTLETLEALGFSPIEAGVYAALLRESPATGYRISHAIGKPTANTYKAIRSLERRGAVVVEDGKSRLCRAVPPAEVLGALEQRFQANKRAAADALARLSAASTDERVWTLETPESIWERAAAMLSASETLVALDVMPAALERVGPQLVAAAGRGVEVFAKVYDAPSALPGVQLLRRDDGPEALAFWPGCQLTLVADACSFLMALFSRDLSTVYRCVWSESVFLACMQHNSLAAELLGARRLDTGEPLAEADALRLTLGREDLPGRRRLFERCAEIDRERE